MLDSTTVEDVFDRLLARYGSAWRAKWQGVEMIGVKADWAEALSGVSRASIAYALQYLPHDFPPNAAQFADLCRRAPRQEPKQLPMPEATEAERERVRELLAEVRRKLTSRPVPAPKRTPEEETALFEPARLDELKRQSAKKVEDYARARGIGGAR